MRYFFFTSLFCFLANLVFSQVGTTYNSQRISVSKNHEINPTIIVESYNATLINLEAPKPDGNSVKSHLLRQKMKVREMYPTKSVKINKKSVSTPMPTVGQQFPLIKYFSSLVINLIAGIPCDNTLAVSNDDIVLTAMNSLVFAYDLERDTAVFPNFAISLLDMAGGASLENYYDPKVIYDKEKDRFILVFLKDNNPATNKIIVCFSTTNNPNDPWNVYQLPGNPLNNNRWTDFPAIALTDTDLFITGNLIVPNVSWQIGFDGSVIWQIEKENGYNGDSSLNTVFYSDVKYNGKFVRNLHPVQGADGAADEMFLLSNRNFDLSNDSIFIAHIEGTTKDTLTSLTMSVEKSNVNYGMPPNGRQFDTNLLDTTSGLQTNDARVLGAVKIGDNVQFVSNTVNPATGLSAIYHGTINSVANSPNISATIIGDTVKDYAYPNIAWTGNEECDIETVIGFNYTSFIDFPGVACVYYDNNGNYSAEKIVKQGGNYVDRLPGTYERWGDYFGMQRHYSKPGSAFSFGYYTLSDKKNTGWCAELISPDTSSIYLTIDRFNQASLCNQEIIVSVIGGVPPYNYEWSNDAYNNSSSTNNLCLGDSLIVTVVDSRGCAVSKLVYGEAIPVGDKNTIYPNPFSTSFAVQFTLNTDKIITARIYDVLGRIVTDLIHRNAKEGLNELVFSLLPLNIGQYILVIEADGEEIVNEKIVKNE